MNDFGSFQLFNFQLLGNERFNSRGSTCLSENKNKRKRKEKKREKKNWRVFCFYKSELVIHILWDLWFVLSVMQRRATPRKEISHLVSSERIQDKLTSRKTTPMLAQRYISRTLGEDQIHSHCFWELARFSLCQPQYEIHRNLTYICLSI